MQRLLLILALSGCAAEAASPAGPVPEALFRALETAEPLEALQASEKLREEWDDGFLPRLERVLDGSARSALRALSLLGELESPGSARLLLARLPNLAAGPDPEAARLAVAAAGRRGLKEATQDILDYALRTDDPAALRALGRIWEQKLNAPALGRSDEIKRLGVFQLAHRLAMSAASTPDACEAMLRVMTRDELESFLAKHAGDKFFSRTYLDLAVRKRGFDREKGARVHEALLVNPDLDLVGEILRTSPHTLPPAAVRERLDDRREVKSGARICDLAATRLTGKAPATRSEQDALIRTLKD